MQGIIILSFDIIVSLNNVHFPKNLNTCHLKY